MSKVKTFFKTIFKYLAENVWIQPVLLVALIFAIIFGLSGIPGFISSIQAWFNNSNSTTTEKIKFEVLTNDEMKLKLENGNEDFFFVIGKISTSDVCIYCEEYAPILNEYQDNLTEDNTYNGGIKGYYLNIAKENDEYLDTTLEADSYVYWYDKAIADGALDSTTRTSFVTPTTVFVKDGVITDWVEGKLDLTTLESYVSTLAA